VIWTLLWSGLSQTARLPSGRRIHLSALAGMIEAISAHVEDTQYSVLPATLDQIGQGRTPKEQHLRTIAAASLDEQKEVWKAHKPKKR
jgi:hypothetical protein